MQADNSPGRLQYGCQSRGVTVWLIRALLICTALISRLSLFQSGSLCEHVRMREGVCLYILSYFSVTLLGNLERSDSSGKAKQQNYCRPASSKLTLYYSFCIIFFMPPHNHQTPPPLIVLHLAPNSPLLAHSSHSVNERSGRILGVSKYPALRC